MYTDTIYEYILYINIASDRHRNDTVFEFHVSRIRVSLTSRLDDGYNFGEIPETRHHRLCEFIHLFRRGHNNMDT